MNTPNKTETLDNPNNDYIESYQLTSNNEDPADQWGNVWETCESPWDEF